MPTLEATLKQDGRPGFLYPDGWLPGMSLRDYFAGQALMGILSDHEERGSAKHLAEAAYFFADAMIAARDA